MRVTPHRSIRNHATRAAAALAALLVCAAVSADAPWPAFTATTLMGEQVSSERLIGQPTLLVVTPSRGAAQSTRAWVDALRGEFDRSAVHICDILAINLPFFISTDDALGMARDKVPERFHANTWLVQSSSLETALQIPPASEEAFVFVLNNNGNVVERADGNVTSNKVDSITAALARLTD